MYNPLTVIAQYFPFDDFIFTYNLDTAIVIGDVGKAMTQDTSAANKMKLTAVDTVVMGRLETFEDRTQQGGGKVGAVARKLRCKLPYTGTAPALGAVVDGSATAGSVKSATVQTEPRANRVIEVDTVGLTVVVELF